MKFTTESWKYKSMKINVQVILTVAICFVNFDPLLDLKCVFLFFGQKDVRQDMHFVIYDIVR